MLASTQPSSVHPLAGDVQPTLLTVRGVRVGYSVFDVRPLVEHVADAVDRDEHSERVLDDGVGRGAVDRELLLGDVGLVDGVEQEVVGNVDEELHWPALLVGTLKRLQRTTRGMQSFGINVDDDVADRIEERRVTVTDDGAREIVSRSKVANRLLRLGLAAAETLDDADIDVPDGRPREALVRQALLDQVVAEQRDGES